MAPDDPDDLDCRQASRLISLAQERPLEDAERRALKAHLGECLMCTDFEQQMHFLRKALQRFRTG